MMILTNGIGPTIAFIYSKKKKKSAEENENAYDLIYEQIDDWTKKNFSSSKEKELMSWITEQDSLLYRAYTREVLALFSWLKRFAEGMITDNEDENG